MRSKVKAAQYVPIHFDLGCRIGRGTPRTAVTDLEREPAAIGYLEDRGKLANFVSVTTRLECGRYVHDAQPQAVLAPGSAGQSGIGEQVG